MTALWILVGLLLLLAILLSLRAGVSASYDGDGARVDARLGPFRFRIYPPKAKEKRAEKEPEKKKPAEQEAPEAKGGTLDKLRLLLRPVLDTLGKFRRKLRVDRLMIDFTAASADPSRAAMEFGYASAGLGALLALLENTLDIRARDIQTHLDFQRKTPLIIASTALSIRLGALLKIAFPLALTYRRTRKKQTSA